LSTSSYSLLTPRSRKVACKLVGFDFLLRGGMCVLQPWLLPVLEEGLGSSFHHVFGYFSFPLALFSRNTLRDLHVAGRFQSFLWEVGEGLLHAASRFCLGKEGEGLLHATGRPFKDEERSPSLSPYIYTPS